MVSGEESEMPRGHPGEFRHRAAELARLREKPVSQITADLGIGHRTRGYPTRLTPNRRLALLVRAHQPTSASMTRIVCVRVLGASADDPNPRGD